MNRHAKSGNRFLHKTEMIHLKGNVFQGDINFLFSEMLDPVSPDGILMQKLVILISDINDLGYSVHVEGDFKLGIRVRNIWKYEEKEYDYE